MSAAKRPAIDADHLEDAEPLRAGIQSVEVGFELLEALSQAPGALMLRDLAAAAGMSAAKAHRYLVSFQRMGLVVQDPVSTRYDLGPAALRIGLASLVCRTAQLEWSATHLDTRFALRDTDLRVRRAALDMDPGWLDWLGRVATFHYLQQFES